MEKIDRLGWAAGEAFAIFGLRIGIRVSEGQALTGLTDTFPPGWNPARSPVVDHLYSLRIGGTSSKTRVRRFNILYSGSSRIARSMNLEEILLALENDIQLFVALTARKRLFVHAGAVGWRNKAILIPGRSKSGKSTLVAEMVRAGAAYYSDEYAVLDHQGRIHPYPKPLSLRTNSNSRSRRVPVEELGGRCGKKPIPVGLIVASEYKAEARWHPRLLSPAQAALTLLANTVAARVNPQQTLATLKQAVKNASSVKSKRGEAGDIAELLIAMLSGTVA